jgi:hypothetical protein
MLAGATLFSSTSLADTARGEKNIPKHYPGQRYKIDFIQPDHYPKHFDGVGQLDELTEENVVINDTGLPLAPDVTFHVPERKSSVSSKRFVTGERVGYIIGEEGKIESLWLLVRASYDG